MKIPFKTFLALMVSTGIGGAYTSNNGVFSTNGSTNDVQSAINAAAPGNTIKIPDGSFSGWNITINTPVTLQGAGQGSTTIAGNGTNPVLSVNTTGTAARITGFTFDGGTTQSVLVEFSGNSPELVDHCTFIGGDASEMIHNLGMGASDASGWANSVTPGSANALYVEDCTFTKNPLADQYFWGTSAIQSYYGARTVVRHCTLNYCQIDQHGTAGMIGARWWEFYENTFYVPPEAAQGGQSNYFALRGGSGVVFNNHLTGYTANPGYIEIVDENGGSNPLYTGRGINQNPSPIYLWGNDSTMQIGSGSSNVQLNRDYYVSTSQPASMKRWQLTSDGATTTYAYTPYTYPHPLVSGSNPAPAPPTNLKVVP